MDQMICLNDPWGWKGSSSLQVVVEMVSTPVSHDFFQVKSVIKAHAV